jgi:hypothetical protein
MSPKPLNTDSEIISRLMATPSYGAISCLSVVEGREVEGREKERIHKGGFDFAQPPDSVRLRSFFKLLKLAKALRSQELKLFMFLIQDIKPKGRFFVNATGIKWQKDTQTCYCLAAE